MDALAALDADPEIRSFRFTRDRLLIYPFVRFALFTMIINAEYGFESIPDPGEEKGVIKSLRYLWKAVRHNVFIPPWRHRLIFFSSGALNTTKRDGKYFNRIYDHYAAVLPNDSLIVEASCNGEFPRPRWFRSVRYDEIIELAVRGISRIRGSEEIDDREQIRRFISAVRRHSDLEEARYIDLERTLTQLARRLPMYHALYRLLFRITQPRVIFLEEACYGHLSYILRAARELGVVVAEFQHGLVSEHHYAYVYGDSLVRDPEYREYLPDYLLLYGKYWAECINVPVEIRLLGNPQLDEAAMTRVPGSHHERPIMLVISQGHIAHILIPMVQDIVRLTGDRFTIVYRLHPGERAQRERYECLLAHSNVVLNDSGDLYEWLKKADYLVASSSTTVFEAVRFDIPIFILEGTDSWMNIPPHLGIRFSTPSELVSMMDEGCEEENRTDKEYYWVGDWRRRYRSFLAEVEVETDDKM